MGTHSAMSSEAAQLSIVLETVDEAVDTALAVGLAMPDRPVIDATTRDLVGHLRELMAEDLGFDEDPAVQALFREGYRVLDLTRRPTAESTHFGAYQVHARSRPADQALRRRLPREAGTGRSRWLTKRPLICPCAGRERPCRSRSGHGACSSAHPVYHPSFCNPRRATANSEEPDHGPSPVRRLGPCARRLDHAGGVARMVRRGSDRRHGPLRLAAVAAVRPDHRLCLTGRLGLLVLRPLLAVDGQSPTPAPAARALRKTRFPRRGGLSNSPAAGAGSRHGQTRRPAAVVTAVPR